MISNGASIPPPATPVVHEGHLHVVQSGEVVAIELELGPKRITLALPEPDAILTLCGLARAVLAVHGPRAYAAAIEPVCRDLKEQCDILRWADDLARKQPGGGGTTPA